MDAFTPMTADELLRLQPPDKRTELIRGVMAVREPASFYHGCVTARLTGRLIAHADAFALGMVLAAETGFTLARNPDTVRAPDVAFVRAARVPDLTSAPAFPELAPDLVVEVLSPDDRPGKVLAKVGEWLTAGTRLVWVLDPLRRQARIYRGDGSESLLGAGDTLNGESILPGFACPLAELL